MTDDIEWITGSARRGEVYLAVRSQSLALSEKAFDQMGRPPHVRVGRRQDGSIVVAPCEGWMDGARRIAPPGHSIRGASVLEELAMAKGRYRGTVDVNKMLTVIR